MRIQFRNIAYPHTCPTDEQDHDPFANCADTHDSVGTNLASIGCAKR
jgi:hypothetical protein